MLQERLDEREQRDAASARTAGVLRAHRAAASSVPGSGRAGGHKPRELKIPRRYRRQSPPAEAPAISIVTPTDAKPALLDRTIRSVVDQGYEPLEYIVENSAPSERTTESSDRYRDKVAQARGARQREAGRRPQPRAWRRPPARCSATSRPSDLLLPGALAYVARYFEHHPDVDVVYGHRVLVDAEDKEVGRWVLPRHRDEILSWADFVPTETLFWRRRVWEAVGGELNEDLSETVDWDLLLRFRDVGARMERVPRFLGAARIDDARPRERRRTAKRASCRPGSRTRCLRRGGGTERSAATCAAT